MMSLMENSAGRGGAAEGPPKKLRYWKGVFFSVLFLFAAADSILVTEERVPRNHSVNWLAAQARRVIEAPGIYLYERMHPDVYYLNESRNVVAVYILGCNVLMFFGLALVISAFLRLVASRLEKREQADVEAPALAGAGAALAAQSITFAVVGIFALGYAFGLLALLSAHAALARLNSHALRWRAVARLAYLAGIVLVVVWTLGNYFASPLQSVFFDPSLR